MILDDLKIIYEYSVPFLIVIFVIVLIHEFGHYIVARFFGVRVNVFSIGFGKELLGYTDKKGTRWRLSLLPLGGYVSMQGEENIDPDKIPEQEKRYSFASQKLYKRALIVVAGPFANFILAILALPFVFLLTGKLAEPGYVIVDSVVAGGPSDNAGLQPNDQIFKANGNNLKNFRDLAEHVITNRSRPLVMDLKRDGKDLVIAVIPAISIGDDGLTSYRIGLRSLIISNEEVTPIESIALGVEETWRITFLTVSGIHNLIFRDRSASNLAGPVRIVQLSRDHAFSGIAVFLTFISILSINLGLVNLFPLPVLDGGHLVFYGIEAIRRKPIPSNIQNVFLKLGFVLLIFLMIFVTINDISSFFK